MGALARYAYLDARVSMMGQRLLPVGKLADLVEQPVSQETELFRLSDAAGLQPGIEVGPGFSLEQRVVTALIGDFLILSRALTGAARELLIYWAHRQELTNLKTIIRGKMSGQPEAAIRAELFDMAPFAALPLDELLRTEDVAELLRHLDRTTYADIARQARRVFEEQHDLFALDAAIDRRYYTGLSQRTERLQGQESARLKELIGTLIDRVNLLWLLRYRFTYGLSPAQTYYLLIPGGHRISNQTLLAASQLASLEEVVNALPQPFAGILQGATTTTRVTQILELHGWQFAESIFRHVRFNIARPFAYLALRERDLRWLRALLRGKLLLVGSDVIRLALGLAGEEPGAAGSA